MKKTDINIDEMVDLVYGFAPEGTLKGDRNAIMKKQIREAITHALAEREQKWIQTLQKEANKYIMDYRFSAVKIAITEIIESTVKRLSHKEDL